MKVGLAIEATREVGQPTPRLPDPSKNNKWSPLHLDSRKHTNEQSMRWMDVGSLKGSDNGPPKGDIP